MATEKQYIDPNELKDMVNGDINKCYQLRIDGIGALSHFLDQINSCKTVYAVEVVRCKDCKWWENGKDYKPYCNHWKSGLYDVANADDFCSYGERKYDDCI